MLYNAPPGIARLKAQLLYRYLTLRGVQKPSLNGIGCPSFQLKYKRYANACAVLVRLVLSPK